VAGIALQAHMCSPGKLLHLFPAARPSPARSRAD
jgi:hypothetical protein